jgi:hypothetical protein
VLGDDRGDAVLSENLAVCYRCLRDRGLDRVPGRQLCPEDNACIVQHAERGDCPIELHVGGQKYEPPPSAGSAWGPALWKEMHTRTDADAAYVDSVTRRLPCGDCKSWFVAYLKEHPPRFDDWFRWTWECHQAANAKLGKPQMTFEQATARWLAPR